MLKYGFTPEKMQHTFDQYERAGSSVFYNIHDLLRFEKHGYYKVRDQLSREIRHGRISKNNAERVYVEYINQGINIKPFFDWIGATDSGLKLFVQERIKHGLCKISQSESFEINVQDFFDIGLFSDKASLIEKNFIIYYKGI